MKQPAQTVCYVYENKKKKINGSLLEHWVMSMSMVKLGSSATRPSHEGVENWD